MKIIRILIQSFMLSTFFLLSSNSIAQAIDPLSSFERIASGYESFFSQPQNLLVKGISSESSVGVYYYVIKFIPEKVKYDVQKTASLVSPYSAYISINMAEVSNSKCGEIPFLNTKIGWLTANNAIGQSNRNECYVNPTDYIEFRFDYAYQHGIWVFKSVSRLSKSFSMPSDERIMNGIGFPVSSKCCGLITENTALEFNSDWKKTLIP